MRETHFTIEFCSDYFERKLSSQETLALFTHIEVCKHCAKTYDFVLAQYRNPSSLRFNFSLPELDFDGHLDGEELNAYSEGKIEKEELDLLEHHAMNCMKCKNALENIVTQKQESKSKVKKDSRLKAWLADLWGKIVAPLPPIRQKNFAYAASLLCLIVISGLVIASFWRSSTPRTLNDGMPDTKAGIQEGTKDNPPSKINSEGSTLTNVNINKASGTNVQRDNATAKDKKSSLSFGISKANRQLVIKDRDDEEILIRSNEINVGAKNISPELSEDIIAALNGKDITPPFYSSDDSAVIKTRGIKPEGESEHEMRLLTPVNKTIRTLTPTFEWELNTILPNVKYQVSVVDEDFNLVAQSPPLKETQWKIETPLARGKKYRWQVKLFVSDEVLSSTAPNKGASFRILSDADNLEITESEKKIKSHLALGVIYLKAGLLDEAENEISALQKLNPKSKEVNRLLRLICNKRNSKDAKLRCMLSESN